MSIWIAGLDLGQMNDYTALIVLEAHGTISKLQWLGQIMGLDCDRQGDYELAPVTRTEIKHIERWRGVKYQRIAELVWDVLNQVPNPHYLVIDETGVGLGVIEIMSRMNPCGVTITAGSQATLRAPGHACVPKRDLVSALQIGLQSKTLKIAKGLKDAALLVNEMQNFRAKISASGHDTYEAWREGIHDDLVLAAALACWMAEEAFKLRASAINEELEAIQLRQRMASTQISPI